jgi:G:T-mismatch repair DNA endonuclease (very short patch repair protein)
MDKLTSFRLAHFNKIKDRLKIKNPNVEFLTTFGEYHGTSNKDGNGYYLFNCLKCNKQFTDYIDNGHIPKCHNCIPNRLKGHPKTINKICSWCRTPFSVSWGKRKMEVCSMKCMYERRKNQNWETVNCLHCETPFRRRKNEKHHRSGKQRMFCCNHCSVVSEYKKDKLRKWGNSESNHWNSEKSQKKVKVTKKKLYGNPNYNNLEKNIETCLKNNGVPYGFWCGKKSTGKRVSKFQRSVYKIELSQYKDAKLEVWLTDVKKSVDIYIPSKKLIIECHGDYWHCNPLKYKGDYYNKQVHMKANEIWDKDSDRKSLLESHGYSVRVVWESDFKKGKVSL